MAAAVKMFEDFYDLVLNSDTFNCSLLPTTVFFELNLGFRKFEENLIQAK